ncbi:MAG TPA: NAD(P)-dependent oxidoreductase [Candidatus Limnocylindrales bacterium]|nr:NAD(P)-dependent oxidoreductase [Candidatus Limnocylindrales bacterium]
MAVTGAGGRLGRAVVAALEDAPFTGPFGPIAWSRAIWDLDAPEAIGGLLDRDRPEVVVHCAAWTDVDGCAREPELAMRRNGDATGVLARAAAERGVDLIVVSTNEVFDGRPAELRPYRPTDPAEPINPYGRSKLAGERFAEAAYESASAELGIVRTAWLFGPPGNDFPSKILAAADRANASGAPLRLVHDEIGSPSYTVDVAEAIAELIGANEIRGVRHLVNAGSASRKDWAEEVLRQAGVSVATAAVSADAFPRASTPPRFGILEPSPLPGGEPLRTWQGATADYLPALLRQRAAAAPVR